MYSNNTRKELNATNWKLFMGLQQTAIVAQGLSHAQRRYILRQSINANILTWLIKQVQLNETHETIIDPQSTNISTNADNCTNLLFPNNPTPIQTNPNLLRPTIWQPLYNPNEWIYTDGSLKKGQSRLGAAVIHSPTSTTTYIDASNQDEAHIIIRAELTAIHVAFNTYK
jgi:hypothetical protein